MLKKWKVLAFLFCTILHVTVVGSRSLLLFASAMFDCGISSRNKRVSFRNNKRYFYLVVEARDDTEHPTVHRIATRNTELAGPNCISSGVVEKPWIILTK